MISDDEVVADAVAGWQHSWWGGMDCDRCTARRKRGAPCFTCPVWRHIIPEHRARMERRGANHEEDQPVTTPKTINHAQRVLLVEQTSGLRNVLAEARRLVEQLPPELTVRNGIAAQLDYADARVDASRGILQAEDWEV